MDPDVPGPSPKEGAVNKTADKMDCSEPAAGLEEKEGGGGAEPVKILKRESPSKKRNYRQTTGIAVGSSAGNESSDEDEPKSTSSRLDDGTSGTDAITASLASPPVPQTPENEHHPEEGADSSMDSNASGSDMTSNNDPDELFLLHGIHLFPGGVEVSDSNSSSPSEDFMHEDALDDDYGSDFSSDSSDSLSDLDDMPIEVRVRSGDDKELQEWPLSPAKDDKKKNAHLVEQLPSVLQKPKPKNGWCAPKELLKRELGYRGNAQPQSFQLFRSKFYGSVFSVERLELMKKLEGHGGCVNCLNFNFSGTKLASGSDDMKIKIWSCPLGQELTSFHSKHKANVFQAKFMPLNGMDNVIVSCSRDTQVRLTELDSSGCVGISKKLAQHRGPVHKLAINPATPHVVLSCGEDGVVYSCDIREDKPKKILNNGRKMALYSISINPLSPHEFCTSGRDEYIRIYDERILSNKNARNPDDSALPLVLASDEGISGEEESKPLKKFCPHHLAGHNSRPHVTSAVYNYNGRELIGSYNDENIYLFDTSHSDQADYVKFYEGHLNSATVKGVNFFGEKSQYIVSGSDDGNIFLWNRETEGIVNFFRGDQNGVVNCLEPHPSAPILATSGLDDDIKIWLPSNEKPNPMGDLARTVKRNIKKRKKEIESRPNALDGEIMWQLIHHLHQEQRRRRREEGLPTDSSSGENSSDDDDDDELEGDGDGDEEGHNHGHGTGHRGTDCTIV